MAKLPPFSRFLMEDFPRKYDDLLPKLIRGLNAFMESVIYALANRLTFEENFAAQVIQVDITAPISPASPFLFKSTLNGQCRGIMIVNAINLTSPTTQFTAAPFVSFENGTGQVRITGITGLTAGNTYRLRLVCLA